MKKRDLLFLCAALLLSSFMILQFSCKKDKDSDPTSQNGLTARFTVSPSSGTTSTNFAFDASGSTDTEDPTSDLQVRWDFDGNGSWDTGWDYDKTVNHQYGNEGTYTVKMEVKDTEGLTDNTTKQINVSGGSNTPPTALFTVSTSSGTTSTNFAFDASGSTDNEDPTSDLQVRWDFDGNGSWDTNWDYDKTVNHQYGSEGTYAVKMEVKDTEGLTDYVTHNITVNNGGGNGCEGVTYVNYEGQTYHTVEIGNQCWFKENLNVGTRIDGSQSMSNNGAIEKYCYDDNEANCDTYGGLYQWNEMMQYTTTQGTKGICPAGWHLPCDDEWKTLEMALGMSQSEADDTGYRGTDEGGKMKETGYAHWNSPNTGATNTSGFTALPGGVHLSDGFFLSLGDTGWWWSSSAGWLRGLNYDNVQVRRDTYGTTGFSVRCLKD
jgi:uncharacterized protein (TIGR02145 family)